MAGALGVYDARKGRKVVEMDGTVVGAGQQKLVLDIRALRAVIFVNFVGEVIGRIHKVSHDLTCASRLVILLGAS